MQLIVSTCGTSTLTNLVGQERALVIKYANCKTADEIAQEDRQTLQSVIDKMRHRLETQSTEELARLSAELNSLLRFYEGRLNAARDTHWLIATDTWLGQSTAEAIGKVLERYGHTVNIKAIRDLRTDSLADFHVAMSEIAALCAEELRAWREQKWNVVFNLTGGFKSVQGFMQTLGMLYADETVYVFERTNELLRIPRLPIRMDIDSVLEDNPQRLKALQRMAIGLSVTDDQATGLPETLLLSSDGQATLSTWGEIVWDSSKSRLLAEHLPPPITERLRYAPTFQDTVAQYRNQKDRLYKINERLMDLARHLEDNSYNPARLDFKLLKGKHSPSTHECDAWSDKDARRIFGHFEDDVFVVDNLKKGLH